MTTLGWNRYGKSGIRLVKVHRPGGDDRDQPHRILDLTIDVQLEGAFEPVYVDGDNAGCLATDTMKNTVYALARHDHIEHVESFCSRLAEHFAGQPLVERVRIAAVEQCWERLLAAGALQPHAFVQPAAEQWTAQVLHDSSGASTVITGLTNLMVMKTANSAFSGFPRDRFTTLPDTEDRLLATSMTAAWTHRPGTSDFSTRDRIRAALLATFAVHDSRSVQHTLYAMAQAALAASDISEITLTLPNRHHLLVDLEPFGLDNPNVVFVATDRPFGVIEATVRR
jgi:urate oxidase